eukprot:TRINITY_DN4598_c1_g3_i1.p1 TRINITY_DN4598_c1_g3~~TRINITY_DN4598_c1_g3_i1.p1  ORF type:complete len:392 (-),score=25.56 TRINITY_DN4598_c1_g3_i1:3127-4302(-)
MCGMNLGLRVKTYLRHISQNFNQSMSKPINQQLWLAEYTLQWLVDLQVGKRILVAVDESPISRNALQWVVKYLASDHDCVQVVTVAPLVSPLVEAHDRTGQLDSWSAQRVLERAISPIRKEGKAKDSKIQTRILTAIGGTSGIGNVIINYARLCRADMVVVGSRGVNCGLKQSLMSVVGLGSVSKHCIHHSDIPVLVLHGRTQLDDSAHSLNTFDLDSHKQRILRICIAIDGGAKSYEALEWACQNIIRGTQFALDIVSVSLPVPQFDRDSESEQEWGKVNCERAREMAHMNGVSGKQISVQTLGISSFGHQIGESICQYVRENKVDVLVLGARNMSDLQRSVLKFVGLGSVSDYCVQNLLCPVLVYKNQIDQYDDMENVIEDICDVESVS